MQFLSPLNAYGSVVLFLMMIFYIKENKSSKYTLLFGIMCIGSSAYGFLAGTWPFGIIEAAWALFSFDKFRKLYVKSRNDHWDCGNINNQIVFLIKHTERERALKITVIGSARIEMSVNANITGTGNMICSSWADTYSGSSNRSSQYGPFTFSFVFSVLFLSFLLSYIL